MAILIETMPAPRAFKGEDATASMMINDTVAVTNRGIYVPEPLFSRGLGDAPVLGGFMDVSLDLIAILAVLFAGIFVSKLIKKRAHAIQQRTGVRPKTWHLSLAVIVIPTAILLWFLGFHLGYPELKGFNFQGGTYMRNSLIALWLALTLYTSAFIAEIVRAGILAVSKGQSEAAAALGIKPSKNHEPCDFATSDAHYRATADLAIPET